MLLHRLCAYNRTENRVYYISDHVNSKYVHGFKYKSNDAEICSVLDMMIILNYLEFESSCWRNFKLMTILITGYMSSSLNLHLNSWAYLQTALPNPSYTEFSVSLVGYNLFKKNGSFMWILNSCATVKVSISKSRHWPLYQYNLIYP